MLGTLAGQGTLNTTAPITLDNVELSTNPTGSGSISGTWRGTNGVLHVQNVAKPDIPADVASRGYVDSRAAQVVEYVEVTVYYMVPDETIANGAVTEIKLATDAVTSSVFWERSAQRLRGSMWH